MRIACKDNNNNAWTKKKELAAYMEYQFRLSALESRNFKIRGRSYFRLYAERGPIMSGVVRKYFEPYSFRALFVCKDNEYLKSFYSEASG